MSWPGQQQFGRKNAHLPKDYTPRQLDRKPVGQGSNLVTLTNCPDFQGVLSGFQIPHFRLLRPHSSTPMPAGLSHGDSHLLLPKMPALMMAQSASIRCWPRMTGQDKKLVGHSGPSQMRNQEARITLVRPASLAENECKFSQNAK